MLFFFKQKTAYDIGEGLVKGAYVRVGRRVEVWTQAIDDCVGHLVSDDVVRQASEDRLAGQVQPRRVFARAIIAKQDGAKHTMGESNTPTEQRGHQAEPLGSEA